VLKDEGLAHPLDAGLRFCKVKALFFIVFFLLGKSGVRCSVTLLISLPYPSSSSSSSSRRGTLSLTTFSSFSSVLKEKTK